MLGESQDLLLRSEERYKEKVYRVFDNMCESARKRVESKNEAVYEGAYEDQDAFMVYGELAGAHKSLAETDALIASLYKKPYFAHVEVKEEGEPESESEHYYLSDCESLEHTISIGLDGCLIPFKQDKKRPISVALFHCYQIPKGNPVTYAGPGGVYTLVPQLICDDEIKNRLLINAVQLFPESDVLQITADELLEEKLQENRNNPTLRNIIATLQRMQFEIIEADSNTSFVVQGCAGSGKSQCLLHRLFFLRDTLSQDGWNHVLLITPTQLFRNYSAELIRRYQLSSVENFSIAELYRRLLMEYDPRFRNRQYQFELSEEYLPDAYLKEVYDPTVIAEIEKEISKAIRQYVKDGCTALGTDIPKRITNIEISDIVQKLDVAVHEFDDRERILQQDTAYAEHRARYEAIQKRIDNLQKRHDKLLEEQKQCDTESAKMEQLRRAVEEAEQTRSEWLDQRETNRKAAVRELAEIIKQWDAGKDVQIPARYAQRLFIAQDILTGDKYKTDEEFARFLDEYCAQTKVDLAEIIKKSDVADASDKSRTSQIDSATKAEEISKEIVSLGAEAEEYEKWMRERTEEKDGEQSRRTLRRSEMERARYFLSRIESFVFEREVWNALEPRKKKYHIQTLQIESLQERRQRENRILYKSDLLFYLKIYAELYPDAILPDYRMICVDEGQDLHKGDYDMLHKLYPRAVFNIFGDTNQVLHTACGIHDWKKETGIPTLYVLNKNYRNTAAIVDFCNRSFASSMEYIGNVRTSQQPHRIDNPVELSSIVQMDGIVVIVHDRNSLEQLCMKMGKTVSEFEYLDTKAEKKQSTRTPCYSIFAAKGLEFTNVLVYAKDMTVNQKVVACTRAMEELYYYE